MKKIEGERADSPVPSYFWPPKRLLCSQPFNLFVEDSKRQIDFIPFSLHLVQEADESSFLLAEAILKMPHLIKDEKQKRRLEHTVENRNEGLRFFETHIEDLCRNAFVSSMDGFFWYLSAIIQKAMKKRPELMKSSDTLRLDRILDFKRRSELVSYVIDKTVNGLAYGGLADTLKYLSDRLGIDADVPDTDVMKVLVELRNIAVHNRGYVNRVYLSRAPVVDGYPTQLGERFFYGPKLLEEMTKVCFPAAINIDGEVSKKFGIKRKRFDTWHRQNEELWKTGYRRL